MTKIIAVTYYPGYVSSMAMGDKMIKCHALNFFF